MSFVCPECGYRDLPIWRHTYRRLYSCYCHLSDLEEWNPELAKLVKEKGFICINHVKYKLNRKGTHVHRIPAYLCANPSETNPSILEPNKEKHFARILGKMPEQKCLEVPL